MVIEACALCQVNNAYTLRVGFRKDGAHYGIACRDWQLWFSHLARPQHDR
jgi:hypothetical protein